ncbi:MAG: flavodoxin family protein [Hydrogeniiclostridium mannosilyticum]
MNSTTSSVGFPNWWGDMPMILYTFFDTYDLSGKTVALFSTSGGEWAFGYGK